MGITFYELCANKLPFENSNNLPKLPERFKDLNNLLERFISTFPLFYVFYKAYNFFSACYK